MTTEVEVQTENKVKRPKVNPETLKIPGERYIVRHVDPNDRTDVGLYLPPKAQEDSNQTVMAQVVNIGMGRINEKNETVPMPLPLTKGDFVIVGKYAGNKFVRDENYRIIHFPDVLAIVPKE